MKKRIFIEPFLYGLASSLIFAPTYILPILFFILNYILSKEIMNRKEIFAFSLGSALSNFYWISTALLIEIKWYYLLLFPIALLSSTIIFSIFYYVPIVIYFKFKRKYRSPLLITILFLISEFIRANIATGFPWNMFAHALTFSPITMQIAYYIGEFGLSFILLYSFSCLVFYFHKKNILYLIKSFFIISLNLIVGFIILQKNPEKENFSLLINNNINFQIIEANLKQNERDYHNDFKKYINLTKLDSKSKNIIIWPEGILISNYKWNKYNPIKSHLEKILDKNSYLISGASYLEENQKIYNSLLVFNPEGRIINNYFKIHLAPFGEYIPNWLAKLAPFVSALVEDSIGFAKGSIDQDHLNLHGITIMPLICYEGIFSKDINNRIKKNGDPDLLLNITNDGWINYSTAPYQNFAIVRLQSVLFRKPLIRVNVIGISAKIDPFGRIIE